MTMVAASAAAVMVMSPDFARRRDPGPLPDRVSGDKKSPFYIGDVNRIGIIFKGVERFNVYEYCVSEGWIRVMPAGHGMNRDGTPRTLKMQGVVVPFWR